MQVNLFFHIDFHIISNASKLLETGIFKNVILFFFFFFPLQNVYFFLTNYFLKRLFLSKKKIVLPKELLHYLYCTFFKFYLHNLCTIAHLQHRYCFIQFSENSIKLYVLKFIFWYDMYSLVLSCMLLKIKAVLLTYIKIKLVLCLLY